MTFVLSMLCVVLYVALFKKSIKSHALFHYIGAAILAVIIVLNPFTGFPQFFKTYIQPILTNGGIATAMFVLVMYAGAFKNGAKPKKMLMSLRAELSIIACTLTFAHNVTYGQVYLKHLFTNPSMIPLNFRIATYISITLFLIMLPLWITSYSFVRKKMKAKTWKKLQRWAYLFYALIYAHVAFIMIPLMKTGNTKYIVSMIVYSFVFGIYAVMRTMNSKMKGVRKPLIYVCLAIVFSFVSFYSYSYAMAGKNLALEIAQDEQVEQESADETSTPSEEDTAVSEEAEVTTLGLDEETLSEALSTTEADSTVSSEETTQTISTENMTSSQTQSSEGRDTEETTKVVESTQTTSEKQTTVFVEKTTEADTTVEATQKTTEKTVPATMAEQTTTQAPTTTEAPTTEPPTTKAPTKYTDGTYTASGDGFKGKDSITVSVTIENDTIKNIKIVSYLDDAPYVEMSKPVINKIIKKQSANVDAVSGATFSSNAIMDGVKRALQKALNK